MKCSYNELCEKIDSLVTDDESLIVALSGFGGAGKSSTAIRLANDIDGVAVISSDDFSTQVSYRSDDWGLIDRERMIEQVLEPTRRGELVTYEPYDWPNDRLADPKTLEPFRILLLEGIGIIHPDTTPYFDLSIWIDCPLEVASEQGRRRDREVYKVNHDHLWNEFWTPNDRDYFEKYCPDLAVDVLLTNLPDQP